MEHFLVSRFGRHTKRCDKHGNRCFCHNSKHKRKKTTVIKSVSMDYMAYRISLNVQWVAVTFTVVYLPMVKQCSALNRHHHHHHRRHDDNNQFFFSYTLEFHFILVLWIRPRQGKFSFHYLAVKPSLNITYNLSCCEHCYISQKFITEGGVTHSM